LAVGSGYVPGAVGVSGYGVAGFFVAVVFAAGTAAVGRVGCSALAVGFRTDPGADGIANLATGTIPVTNSTIEAPVDNFDNSGTATCLAVSYLGAVTSFNATGCPKPAIAKFVYG